MEATNIVALPISLEEHKLLVEYNAVREATNRFPEGSALRMMLDKRLSTLEIQLGI